MANEKTNLQKLENAGFKFFPCNPDKSPAVKWQSPENHITAEKAAGLQITGGAIPAGCIVLDLDAHTDGQKSGLENLKEALKTQRGRNLAFTSLCKNTFTVKTGSGGRHLFFKLPEGLEPWQTGRKDLQIDIKGGGKGYIITPGSRSAAGEYTPVNSCSIQEITPEFYSFLRNLTQAAAVHDLPAPTETNNQDKKQLFISLGATEGNHKAFKKALEKDINPLKFANNQNWQDFIASSKATFGEGPEIEQALIDWSRKDPKYAQDPSIEKRIRSFKKEGGITPGTLRRLLENVAGLSPYKINQIMPESFVIQEARQAANWEKLDRTAWTAWTAEQKRAFYSFGLHSNLAGKAADAVKAYFNGNLYRAGAGFAVFNEKTGIFEDIKAKSEALKSFFYKIAERIILCLAGDPDFINYAYAEADKSKSLSRLYSGFIDATDKNAWMIDLLECLKGIVPDIPEADPLKLAYTHTLLNGVLDFSTSEKPFCRPGRREEGRRQSEALPYTVEEMEAAAGKRPFYYLEYLATLHRDEDIRRQALQIDAIAAAGDPNYKKIFIQTGKGNTGKSNHAGIIRTIFPSYYHKLPENILLQSSFSDGSDKPQPAICDLKGKRFIFAGEPEQGKFNQPLLKRLSGGSDELITARRLHAEAETFAMSGFIFIQSNSDTLPAFAEKDEALKNRVVITPFKTKFLKNNQISMFPGTGAYYAQAEETSDIKRKIEAERPKIIYYLAEIAQEVRKRGFIETAKEADAWKESILDNRTTFDEWATSTIIQDPAGTLSIREACSSFQQFRDGDTDKPGKPVRSIKKELLSLYGYGVFTEERTKKDRFYKGVRFRTPEDDRKQNAQPKQLEPAPAPQQPQTQPEPEEPEKAELQTLQAVKETFQGPGRIASTDNPEDLEYLKNNGLLWEQATPIQTIFHDIKPGKAVHEQPTEEPAEEDEEDPDAWLSKKVRMNAPGFMEDEPEP